MDDIIGDLHVHNPIVDLTKENNFYFLRRRGERRAKKIIKAIDEMLFYIYKKYIHSYIYTHASGTLNFATDSTFDCTKSADANLLMVMNFDQNFPSHYSHHER